MQLDKPRWGRRPAARQTQTLIRRRRTASWLDPVENGKFSQWHYHNSSYLITFNVCNPWCVYFIDQHCKKNLSRNKLAKQVSKTRDCQSAKHLSPQPCCQFIRGVPDCTPDSLLLMLDGVWDRCVRRLLCLIADIALRIRGYVRWDDERAGKLCGTITCSFFAESHFCLFCSSKEAHIFYYLHM